MSYIGFLDCYKKYLVKDKVKNFVKKMVLIWTALPKNIVFFWTKNFPLEKK